MTERLAVDRRTLLKTGGLALGLLIVERPVAALAMQAPSAGGGHGSFFAQVKQIVEELRVSGEPLSGDDTARVLRLAERGHEEDRVEVERILDQRTLVHVALDRYGVGASSRGAAAFELRELGWRSFLLRVENPAGLTGAMLLISRAAIPEGRLQTGLHEGSVLGNDVPEIVRDPIGYGTRYGQGSELRWWLGYRLGPGAAGGHALRGAPVEYILVQLYSQLGGTHSAAVAFGSAVLQGIGPAPSYRIHDCTGFVASFSCQRARTVRIRVRDWDGEGAMASLKIRDEIGRLYPAPAHRLEPDLGYQPQIYRADGESVRLPPGRYTVIAQRGPEYVDSHQELVVASGERPSELDIRLERWIDPARLGWYSGDPHIHPEGQRYEMVSSFGLTPETMIRQVRGEGLNFGSILIWSNGYYYQKQFLTGAAYQPSNALPFPEVQRVNNTSLEPQPTPHDQDSVIRYDVEHVDSPSARLGHLILLRLQHHDYPGARSLFDWPSWNLPVMQWARAQGAVVGYAHIGRTTDLGFTELPNYDIPAFDDIGAAECLVDVTHGVVDFLSGCRNQAEVELNLWYHLLNCGFRIPLIAETDFVYWSARAGAGRTYVRLDGATTGNAGYEAWAEGIRAGRLYAGDGRSHFIDFRANGQPVSSAPLQLPGPGRVTLSAQVAARLEPTPFDVDNSLRQDNVWQYWHIERARIGESRLVPVEVIVNGRVAERREFLADGQLRDLSFTLDVTASAWVALRIMAASHTAPIFVHVAGQPVRASRRSARWCLDCVDAVWRTHEMRIRASERAAASAAWDHARSVYRQIISECEHD
jgi:hypothetical protein